MSKKTNIKLASNEKKKTKKASIVIDKSLKRSKSSFFKKKLNDANEFLSKHGVPA